jgi:hypothetical protein
MKKSLLILCSGVLLLIGVVGLLLNSASGVNLTVTQANAPALTFDGTNDYVDCGTTVGDYTNTFTLLCWYRTSIDSDTRLITRRSVETQYDFYVRRASAGKHSLGFYTGTDYYGAEQIAANGFWHHAAVVVGGADSVIYFDGNISKTFSPTIISRPTEHFIIGALGNGGYMNGAIADSRIFNRALSQVEVRQVMAGQNITSGLIGWWPLSNGGGSTVYDVSGNGNHGTLQNFTLSTAWAGRQNQYLYGLQNGQSLYQNSSSLDVQVPYWFRASDGTFQPYTSTAYLPIGYTKTNDTPGRGFPKTSVSISGVTSPATNLIITGP